MDDMFITMNVHEGEVYTVGATWYFDFGK